MKITRIAMLLLLGVLLVFLLPVPMATADDVVNIPDPNLEAGIRKDIGKPVGDIYESDLLGLTVLYAWYGDITDLNGLEYCTNLEGLYLRDSQIGDISPLSSLTSLTLLGLSNSQIGDISPLSSLTSLTQLYLVDNQISDISPLSSLTSLKALSLIDNQISDISPLSSLTSLAALTLVNNQISDISPLSGLISLTTLYLIDNQISDIEPLVDNPGLSSGDDVYLNGNPLSTASIDTYIPQLKARGVTVEYNASTPPFWLWIVIGVTGSLLVLLVAVIYLRVFRKSTVKVDKKEE